MPPTTIKPRNILIFGATGTIGTYILNSLITGKSHFNRLAIFTSPSTVENKADTIADLKARGVEVIVGDVRSEEDVWGAYKGAYIYVYVHGTGDIGEPGVEGLEGVVRRVVRVQRGDGK
ncbi:hypothetical protein FQN51_006901 [Onygenales sp. PD_10]|nr:hypothetical protein FQN51_006901 [Onygenales sp. PD_10]